MCLFDWCRGNAQVAAFTLLITCLAACNALLVPLLLEAQIAHHPSTVPVKLAGQHPEWFTSIGDVGIPATANVSAAHQDAILQRVYAYATSKPPAHRLLPSMLLGLSRMRLRVPLLLQHMQFLGQHGRALATSASMGAAGAPFTSLANTSGSAYSDAAASGLASGDGISASTWSGALGQPGTCGADMSHFMRNLRKHADEIAKMEVGGEL